jgi:hypothetical protein
MAQAITVRLHDDVYQQLAKTAELSEQPIDLIIEQSLQHSLPPLLKEVPAEYQADVYPLLEMDTVALQNEVKQVLDADRWAEYDQLLAKKKTGLSHREERRLEDLRREADILMLRKGYAAVLLKRRGYAVPSPADLTDVK